MKDIYITGFSGFLAIYENHVFFMSDNPTVVGLNTQAGMISYVDRHQLSMSNAAMLSDDVALWLHAWITMSLKTQLDTSDDTGFSSYSDQKQYELKLRFVKDNIKYLNTTQFWNLMVKKGYAVQLNWGNHRFDISEWGIWLCNNTSRERWEIEQFIKELALGYIKV